MDEWGPPAISRTTQRDSQTSKYIGRRGAKSDVFLVKPLHCIHDDLRDIVYGDAVLR